MSMRPGLFDGLDLPPVDVLRERVREQLRFIDGLVKFEGEHSGRGPSAAHRWRACPGSVARCAVLPNEAGMEAALGTVFHEFAAICVEQDLDPQGFVGAKMTVEGHGVITFDQEMADSMIAGLDLIRSYESNCSVMIVERKVSLREWVGEGEFGTADVIIIDFENGRVIAFDWKYGQGVMVHPIMNDQAMLYVLGAWTDIIRPIFAELILEFYGEMALEAPWEDDIPVHVVIEQPRGSGGGGVWETTMRVILSEGQLIQRDAKLTEREDAPISPGEKQCKFCAAARFNACRERAEYILSMACDDFEVAANAPEAVFESPVRESALTPEERSRVLIHKTQIETYLKELHAEAYRDAEQGRPTPGLKLVEGRHPPRVWKDPKKAEVIVLKRLGNDAYKPREILSPSAVQSTVGKRTYQEHYARHVDVGVAKAVLVSDSDPREAFKDVTADFDVGDDITDLV